jgi:hypothetical protein
VEAALMERKEEKRALPVARQMIDDQGSTGEIRFWRSTFEKSFCTPQMTIEAKLLLPRPNGGHFSTLMESDFGFNFNFNFNY